MVKNKNVILKILIFSIIFLALLATFLVQEKHETKLSAQSSQSNLVLTENRTELTIQSTALDANLYQALYNKYEMANGVAPEGLTNLSFVDFTELTITNANIESISGLELFYFDNLEVLNFSGNSITKVNTINFSNMPKLKKLYLNDQKEDILEKVDFSIRPNNSRDEYYLPNLSYLNISGNLIKTLNLEAAASSTTVTGLHTLLASNNQLSSVDLSGILNANAGQTFIDLSNNLFTNSNDIVLPRSQNITSDEYNVILIGNAISNIPEEISKINFTLGMQTELINQIKNDNAEKSELIFEMGSNLTYGKINNENIAITIKVTQFKMNGEEKNIISTSYIKESDLTSNFSNLLPKLGIGEFELTIGTLIDQTFTELKSVAYEVGDDTIEIELNSSTIKVLPDSPVVTLTYKDQTYEQGKFPKITSPATLNFSSSDPNAEIYYSTNLGKTWVKGNSYKITTGGANQIFVKSVVNDYESNINKAHVAGSINLYLSNGALFVIILAVTIVFFAIGLPLAAKFLKKR